MASTTAILGAKARAVLLSQSIRHSSECVVKADTIEQAMSSKAFARASDGTQCDAAILHDVLDPQSLPDNPTERFYILSDCYKGKGINNAILLNIKSFSWEPHKMTRKEMTKGKDAWRSCEAKVHLSKAQADGCQILIITNMMESDLVAVIPRPYIQFINSDTEEGVDVLLGLPVGYTMATSCPLPPELNPFIMPVTYLATALESIAGCVNGNVAEVRNPHTRLLWSRLSGWQPQLSPFDDLLASEHSIEERIEEQLYHAFEDADNDTGCRIKFPRYSQITTDIRLDHTSGEPVFIDIQVGCINVTELPGGGAKLEHSAYKKGTSDASAMFTVLNMCADYTLSLPKGEPRTVAWLMKRDDWPRSFWHCEPRTGDWLTHDYADATFLDARKVRLNAGMSALVSDISGIVLSQGIPQHAILTFEDVLEFAGPCPPRLVLKDLNKLGVENNVDEGVDKTRMHGNDTFERTALLFNRLLTESRHSGKGCPVFLGHCHSFGPIGFILHTWDDNDKRIFDTTGQPPSFVGKISNETPMVTLVQQYSTWRTDYAPLEGSPAEIAAIKRAHPCLVVCQSLSKELDHHLQALWLIPSEFVPKVSLGQLKDPHDPSCRCPLFLSGKHSIDRFTVNVTQLHAQIMEFLKGKSTIRVGLGEVKVDPSLYLKNLWEYRNSSEVNFDRTYSQARYAV